MSKKAVGIISFIAGAAVGGFFTWNYVKKKYEQIAQEEIDSVKEVFAKNKDKRETKSNRDWSALEDDDEDEEIVRSYVEESAKSSDFDHAVTSYKNLMRDTGYLSHVPDVTYDRPYVINPSDFGEYEDYVTCTLFYTEDGVLLDDHYERVDDPDFTVGVESLTHIGDYEDDCVHVRNDSLKSDYEILVEARSYSEILRKELHRGE